MKKTATLLKDRRHIRRKKHVRKKVFGTSEAPRVTVSRSINNLYAQAVNDDLSVTILGLGTLNKEIKNEKSSGGNVIAATDLGKKFAEKAKEKGISKIVFDRNGYKFHGRVKAFAEALREGGLKF